ncbi:MAG: NUDIX domain-containing protein [Candidatus Tectimicrobiota bacterium]
MTSTIPHTGACAEVAAVPAATVILLRAADTGLETLLLRRNAALAFHGGAWVFPGGRIDAADCVPEAPTDTVAAARRAAVREAYEEAGVVLRPEDLVLLSHWTTPVGRPKRFATWFFVASAGTETVRIDGGEIHDHQWMQPEQALGAQRAGDIELPPPTFVTLVQLAAYRSLQDALERIAAQPPTTFVPRPATVPEGSCTLYAGDAGYDTSDALCPGPRHRLWMLKSGWRYEQSMP